MFSISFASPKPDNKIGLYNVFFLIRQVFSSFFVIYLLFLYTKDRCVYGMGINARFTLAVSALLIILISVVCIFSVTANPIPVYPDPEPVLLGKTDVNTVPIVWILFVFAIDFFIDILIVYAGIYLLDRNTLIKNRDVLNFSKKTFLFAVVIISMIGLLSELIFGAWIGGLIIALFLIFLSFVFVSRYILKVSWTNSYRIGLFAIIVNIVVWIVVFTV